MQSPSLFLSLFLCQLLQVFIKPRIGDIHTVCPGNLCFSLCRHACNGKSHGNTVVQMTVQNSSIKCFAACNDHTVFSRYNVSSHSRQVMYHNIQPIGLLYLQFLCVPNHGRALGKGGQNGQNRQFINQSRNQSSFDDRTL